MKFTKELLKGLLKEMKEVVKENKSLDYVIVVPAKGGLHLEVFKNQQCLVDKEGTARFLSDVRKAKRMGYLTSYSESFPRVFLIYLDVYGKNDYFYLKNYCISLHAKLSEIDKTLTKLLKYNINPIGLNLDEETMNQIDSICQVFKVHFNKDKKEFHHLNYKYLRSENLSKETLLNGLEKNLLLDNKVSLLLSRLSSGVPFLILTFNLAEDLNGIDATKLAKGFIKQSDTILEELKNVNEILVRISNARSALIDYNNVGKVENK